MCENTPGSGVIRVCMKECVRCVNEAGCGTVERMCVHGGGGLCICEWAKVVGLVGMRGFMCNVFECVRECGSTFTCICFPCEGAMMCVCGTCVSVCVCGRANAHLSWPAPWGPGRCSLRVPTAGPVPWVSQARGGSPAPAPGRRGQAAVPGHLAGHAPFSELPCLLRSPAAGAGAQGPLPPPHPSRGTRVARVPCRSPSGTPS